MNMKRIIEKLINAPEGLGDYVDYLEEALDCDPTGDPIAMFPHAFTFFENHSDADLGMPGPLVHFLEKYFPQYTEGLCKSVDRQPTHYTLWMINRILNADINEKMRIKLINTLKKATEQHNTDEAIKREAQELLNLNTP